tara:strand:+ start:3132 stop:4271 length:1140 start_codon:yes stop_codon:yes gene_type:complete
MQFKKLYILKELYKSFFSLLFSQINKKKDFVFYSESLFYKNYYYDLLNKLNNKKKSVSILSSDINEYLDLKNNNFNVYFIGTGFFRILVFNIINCNNFLMTMTDIGNNLNKSKFCDKYIYFFHCMHSTHKMYTEKAFDNYNVIFTIGQFQTKEIIKNENVNKLNKKKIFETGYFYLDFLEKNCNKKISDKKNILFAPSWNYDQNNLFNNHGYNIIDKLLKSNFELTFRPHPEIIKRNKNEYIKIINQFKNNNSFKIDNHHSNINSMEKASLLITDNSSIAVEYSFVFYRPVIFIDYKDKIHNKNYEKISNFTFEGDFKNKIGISISNDQIDNLGQICEQSISNSFSKRNEIDKIKNEYLSNISNSVDTACKILTDVTFS